MVANQPVGWGAWTAGGAVAARGVGAGMGAGPAGVMPLTAASCRGSFASSFICLIGSTSSGGVTRLKLSGSGSLWFKSSWRMRSIV
jgi:hypothetical protein